MIRALLQKPEDWERDNQGRLFFAGVRCGKLTNGAATCPGHFCMVSRVPLAESAPGVSATFDLRQLSEGPWAMFNPGWKDHQGVWALTADVARRLRMTGSPAVRRQRNVNQWLANAVERAPFPPDAKEGRRTTLATPLPLVIACYVCGERQMLDEVVLDAAGFV